MSWRERDYHHSHPLFGERRRRGIEWPGRAAMTLILLHAVAAAGMLIARFDVAGGAAGVIGLFPGAIRPWAILTHPFAMTHIAALALTLFTAWTLGDWIERRFGPGRVVGLYAAGNVAAGAAYAGYAALVAGPDALPLTMPAGALAAWCAAACLGLRDEFVTLLGKLRSMAQVAGVGGAIVLAIALLVFGSRSAAWIVAVVAGFGAGVLVDRLAASIRLPRIRGLAALRRHGGAGRGSRGRRARSTAEPEGPEAGGDAAAPAASAEIDAILAKISRGGMESLSEPERRKLDEARRQMLRRG